MQCIVYNQVSLKNWVVSTGTMLCSSVFAFNLLAYLSCNAHVGQHSLMIHYYSVGVCWRRSSNPRWPPHQPRPMKVCSFIATTYKMFHQLVSWLTCSVHFQILCVWKVLNSFDLMFRHTTTFLKVCFRKSIQISERKTTQLTKICRHNHTEIAS